MQGSTIGGLYGFSIAGLADEDGDDLPDPGWGDVTGDNVPDFVDGAPVASQVTLHSGCDGALIHTWFANWDERFGVSVDAGPDLNGNGTPDILIGASWFDPPHPTVAGHTASKQPGRTPSQKTRESEVLSRASVGLTV